MPNEYLTRNYLSVTPGLIDMHSHAGVYSFPEDAHATQDGSFPAHFCLLLI
jgi:cytosine/adenosine deaminase-related metal-dependent hydrolase